MRLKHFKKVLSIMTAGTLLLTALTIGAQAENDFEEPSLVLEDTELTDTPSNSESSSVNTESEPDTYQVISDPSEAFRVFMTFTRNITDQKPADMTFDLGDVVYQQYERISLTAFAHTVGAVYSAEVYQYCNNQWILVGTYPNISIPNSGLDFSHAIGADGRYGIKIWHNLSGETIQVTGNLTY